MAEGTEGGKRPALTVCVHAATHPGRVREKNEDAIGASRWSAQGEVGLASHRYSGEDAVVCVVADGVGGHSGGEVASGLAVESLVHGPPPHDTAALGEALQAAHELIENRAGGIRELAGMASTVAALVVARDAILCANVGDTRIYDLTTGTALPVSFDDTLAESAGAPAGVPSSVITQALGGGRQRQLDPHAQWFAAEPGLVFLLCSDGLTGVLSDREIAAEFQGSQRGGAVVQRLIDLALARGAPDNVSAMVVSTEGAKAVPEASYT